MVPFRVLGGATYGGINVHPSLLPDLRGAAPIQRAILGGRQFTGVSIQIMHHSKFDHGEIILQTPAPGFQIGNDMTTEDLSNELATQGAALLRDCVERGLFINPQFLRSHVDIRNERALDHAKKITPEDGHINWVKWPAHRIQCAARALGRLWDDTTVKQCNDKAEATRVTYDGKWKVVKPSDIEALRSDRPLVAGDPVRIVSSGTDQPEIAFATLDNHFVKPESITIAGQGKGKGAAHLLRLLNYK
jgi:methionyl-tRNA formyltransferase